MWQKCTGEPKVKPSGGVQRRPPLREAHGFACGDREIDRGGHGRATLIPLFTTILLNCEISPVAHWGRRTALRPPANAHLYGGPPPPAYPPSPVLWYSVVPVDLWPVGLVVPGWGLASPAVLKRSSQPAGSQP